MTTWQSLLTLLIIMICLFLMLVVLVQRGRGTGLAGAFGGAGGSSAFGAKTGDVLTWATVVIAFMFLTVTVVANFKFDESPKPIGAGIATEVSEIPGTDGGTTTDPISIPITVPPLTTTGGDAAPAPAGDTTTTPATEDKAAAPAETPAEAPKTDDGK